MYIGKSLIKTLYQVMRAPIAVPGLKKLMV